MSTFPGGRDEGAAEGEGASRDSARPTAWRLGLLDERRPVAVRVLFHSHRSLPSREDDASAAYDAHIATWRSVAR